MTDIRAVVHWIKPEQGLVNPRMFFSTGAGHPMARAGSYAAGFMQQ